MQLFYQSFSPLIQCSCFTTIKGTCFNFYLCNFALLDSEETFANIIIIALFKQTTEKLVHIKSFL